TRPELGFVSKRIPAAFLANNTPQKSPLVIVLIAQFSKPIRQAKRATSQPHAKRIVHPFRQKINSRFTTMPHIRADIQIFIRGKWFEQPRSNPSSAART